MIAAVCLWAAWHLSGDLGAWAENSFQFERDWLDKVVGWAVRFLALAFSAVLLFLLHKNIVLILLAPILGRLAETTLNLVLVEPVVNGNGFVSNIRRSVRVNVKNLVRELGFTLGAVLIGLVIPFVGALLAAALVFLIEARYCGYGLMDFPLEARGYDVRKSFEFTRTHRGVATGLGAGYLLMMLIPIFGWMIAPAFSTIAGTLESARTIQSDLAPQSAIR